MQLNMKQSNFSSMKRFGTLFGLIVMLLTPSAYLRAGGGMLRIQVDVTIPEQFNITSPASNSPVPLTNMVISTPAAQEHLEGQAAAECPLHHLSAPHLCSDPAYLQQWNPAQLDESAPLGNLGTLDMIAAENQPQIFQHTLIGMRGNVFERMKAVPAQATVEDDAQMDSNSIQDNDDPHYMLANNQLPRFNYTNYAAIPAQAPVVELNIIMPVEDNIVYALPVVSLDEEWLDEEPLVEATEAQAIADESNKQVEAVPALQLSAWPNPSTGRFSTSLHGSSGESIVFQIMTVDGKVIRSASTDSETVAFDLSDQPAGNYFVKATAASGQTWAKSLIIYH
jgi:hypothetical protein